VDRDAFLEWERTAHERNLQWLTNNTRFLVLPWVEVPHLASHMLGLIARRIRGDWPNRRAIIFLILIALLPIPDPCGAESPRVSALPKSCRSCKSCQQST